VNGRASPRRDLEASEGDGLLGSDVVNSRDLGLVSGVVSVEQLPDGLGLDAAKDLLDRPVGSGAVLDGNGSLEVADPLGVRIEDGVDVLDGPEGVLEGEKGGRVRRRDQSISFVAEEEEKERGSGMHLLEPNLEGSVENGDEGDGLLGGSLGDVEEEGLVLGCEELVSYGGVVFEERVANSTRLSSEGRNECLGPVPFTPVNLPSTRRSYSPVRFRREMSTHRFCVATYMSRIMRLVTSSYVMSPMMEEEEEEGERMRKEEGGKRTEKRGKRGSAALMRTRS
jgi:hypothetical protein